MLGNKQCMPAASRDDNLFDMIWQSKQEQLPLDHIGCFEALPLAIFFFKFLTVSPTRYTCGVGGTIWIGNWKCWLDDLMRLGWMYSG